MNVETIVRKDGIVYKRRKKDNNFDSRLNIKIHKETIDKIKKIANEKDIKYNALIRNLIEEYIETQTRTM